MTFGQDLWTTQVAHVLQPLFSYRYISPCSLQIICLPPRSPDSAFAEPQYVGR